MKGVEALHEFFDPRGKFKNDDQELRTALVSHEKRQGFVDVGLVRGYGRIALTYLKRKQHDGDKRYSYHQDQMLYSGLDLLVAEAVKLDTITDDSRDEIAQFAGVSVERLTIIQRQLERHTDTVVGDIAELVNTILGDNEIREELSKKIGINIHPDTSPLVIAGLLLSYASHDGQVRQNEHREYFTHPLAVAYLGQASWDEAEGIARENGIQVPDRQWLYRQMFADLVHDTIEDSIQTDGSSFISCKNSLVTPLLIRKLLVALGETEEEARSVVSDVMLVTKPRDLDGESLTPEDYMQRCTGTIRAMILKFHDTLHNKIIDTKQNKDGTLKTNTEYDIMQNAINNDMGARVYDPFGVLVLEASHRIALKYSRDHEGFMNTVRSLPFGASRPGLDRFDQMAA